MPARELRRRDPGWERVEEPEKAVEARPVAVEDVLVDDLVKKNRSVEDDEAEDERARHAHPEALEIPPEGESGGEEEHLAEDGCEVPGGTLPVKLLQSLMRHRSREPLPQVSDRAVVVAGLHSGPRVRRREEK